MKRDHRHEFIADVAHCLAAEGLRHWQGKAAWASGEPRARVLCINSNGVLQDLSANNYSAGLVRTQVPLVRLKFNFGYRLPGHLQDLNNIPKGRKLELTCQQDDLSSLLPCVTAILLGQACFSGNYAWDPRAAETLMLDTQEWFRQLGLVTEFTLPAVKKSRRLWGHRV